MKTMKSIFAIAFLTATGLSANVEAPVEEATVVLNAEEAFVKEVPGNAVFADASFDFAAISEGVDAVVFNDTALIDVAETAGLKVVKTGDFFVAVLETAAHDDITAWASALTA